MNQELINKILIYIEQHIHEKISLADLAHLAGYSPFYFSTLFAETMGIFLKPDTEIFGELTFEESSVTISKNK